MLSDRNILQYGDASFPADVWAMGVILYTMISGYQPFSPLIHCKTARRRAILRGRFDFHGAAWTNISPSVKDLIARMLVVDPEDRLTAQEVSCNS
jgi:calcium/calmodulin-dependent protein kinase I